MPSKIRKTRTRDSFTKLRLLIAGDIVRNHVVPLALTEDIQHNSYVRELLDEYTIRSLIEWLSTKFGYKIYETYLQTSHKSESKSAVNFLENLHLYPFLDTRSEAVSADQRHEHDNLMESEFAPSAELLGALYEHICNRPLIGESVDTLDVAPDIQLEDKRRIVGQFYTPANIVRYCLDRYLESDSNNLISALQTSSSSACNQGSSETGSESSKHWRLLDPSCGAGNFLIGALRLVAESGVSQATLISFTQNSLFGIELDGKAASLARIAVALELSRWTIDMKIDAQLAVLEKLKNNIVVCDSVLLGITLGSANEELIGSKNEKYSDSFSGSLARFNNFDLVITNPPYVSYGSRNQPEILPSQKILFKSWYAEAAEYKIRLHSMFQDLAIRVCRPGGKIVLLVPDGFLTGSFYGRLRKLLLHKTQIVSLSELPPNTIPGAVVGRWCAAQYCKKDEDGFGDLDYEVLMHSRCEESPLKYQAKISSIVSKSKSRFQLLFSEVDEQITCAMAKLPSLDTELRGHTGIRALKGQSTIVSTKQNGRTWQRGIKSGAQVHPYQTQWDGTWLNIDPLLLYKGGFDPLVISNQKILVRQTGDRLIAGVDEDGYYHLNNVHSFSPIKVKHKPEHTSLDLHLLTALMNSNFWLYLYQLSTREKNRALAQIDIETLESMPLPRIAQPESDLLTNLSRTIHEAKKQSGEAANLVVSTTFPFDRRRIIDRLVYDLYRLPHEQVEHVEKYCRLGQSPTTSDKDLPRSEEVAQFFSGSVLTF